MPPRPALRPRAAAPIPPPAHVQAIEDAFRRGAFADTERLAAQLNRTHPRHAFAWKARSAALFSLGRVDESLAPAREAVRLRPDDANAHSNLGNILRVLRRLDESEHHCRRALALRPGAPEALTNLGNVLRDTERFDEAEACLREAIARDPRGALPYSNLGSVLKGTGRLTEAESLLRQALALQPDLADAHHNLGSILQHSGRIGEAQACFRRALQLDPGLLLAYDSLLFSLNYSASAASGEPHALALRYGEAAASQAGVPFTSWLAAPRPARLRIGFVSCDLRQHPVGYFLESVLEHVDRDRLELVAYSAAHPAKDDALTARLRARFDQWRTLHDRTDAEAAALVHGDAVHVLVDLNGHTGNTRLALFARRPAPVQATWLGYFATTGLAAMDWIVGDPHVTPPDEAHHFRERVWRLPESYLCFTPPDVAVEPGPLPALDAGAITFGSFNNLSKMGPEVVNVWAAILHCVPGARLFLKCKQLGEAALRAQVQAQFAACGIAADRLVLEGASPRAELLAAYRRVDIALDPFPYPGGTTSVEALWMGVPVLTRRGDRFLSHVGESIVTNAGLADWIASSDEEYVLKAVAFSRAAESLALLRCRLRTQVLASPLFDAPRFARHFEQALWAMWQRRLDARHATDARTPHDSNDAGDGGRGLPGIAPV